MKRVKSLRVPAAATSATARQMLSELKRLVDNTHLVSPSISLILSCGEMVHMSKEKKLNEIVVVNMSACYLINMGYLTNCSALRVCILPRNYISKMDALSNCPNLIKLDLHSNHITEIPDELFWREMKCLQVLYLHNNIIGDTCSIEALSGCPQLTVLTLYDTPISLVPTYRHFVVNSIWSLKALDNFVIADEELMEEWPGNDKFKALGPQYSLQSPASSQISTWRSELDNVQKLVGIVNNILAHHSPVHIIQRWVRGHLTRMKLGATSSPGHQGVVCVEVNTLCGRGIHLLQDGSLWVESIRRQGGQRQAVQLHINQLQVKTLQARYEAKELTSGLYPHVSQGKRWDNNCHRSNSPRQRMPDWPNVTPVPGVLGFGSWMDEDEDEDEEQEQEEDVSEATVKPCHILQQPNRAREVLLTHWVSGQDVRQGIQQLHQMGKDRPQPSFTYRPPVSVGTRLYAKSFGCVSLAPFAAIQRAYSERERAARQRVRDDRTRRQKAAEDQARCQQQGQAELRMARPLMQRREDRARGEQAILRRQVERVESLRQLRHNNAVSMEDRHQRAMEQQSTREFNCRYTMMAHTSLKRQIREQNELVRQQKLQMARNIKLHASLVKGQIMDNMLDRELAVQAGGQAADAVDAAASTVVSLAARDRLLRARATVKVLKLTAAVGNGTPRRGRLPGISRHLPTTHTLASASPA
ncbi:LOW QUALITY PROTEIN: leucine-rich repeat and IQ domain-containing protein 3-like [Leucoraja erinacea]|uniref:LOW QUALITY PROTEIN: leucine-rich repeat and IQ domain-containing protein 3-like n=1 Tax=Leucoraja erinaceus TaxID=7782 RepID=UPI0024562B55|nr:LOW QUALITY PROTEIN: leucine-rich repeat and IQ domain-containing protein 3-like [Leucoraja erinacea]